MLLVINLHLLSDLYAATVHSAYLCPVNIDISVKRLRNFCINKNKMVISTEDRMLIKVWHREKG